MNLQDRLLYNPLEAVSNEKIYEKIDWQDVHKHLLYNKEQAYKWINEAIACESKVGKDTLNTIQVDNERRYFGLNNRVQQLNKKFEALQSTIKILNEYHGLEKDILVLRKQVQNELQKSKVAYLKDKIHSCIRCYKDNGLKYTIKRILFKIQNKLS